MKALDIVLPVYNEKENIIEVLTALRDSVRTSFKVLVCYDRDDDNTLPALREAGDIGVDVLLVKNRGTGVHGAVITGFEVSSAPAVLMFPADEPYNAGIIDAMYRNFEAGNDVVVASRFMRSGHMEGGPLLKSLIVRIASFVLRYLVGVPASDASYGLRIFSRRILDTIQIESTEGFTYAIELLVKCHRLGWGIAEVPAVWHRRERGASHFRLRKWLPHYARWFFYAFATVYLRRPGRSVLLKSGFRL